MIYGNTSGPFYNESMPHFRAKMRIATLLDSKGWDVWVDDMKGFAVLALTKLCGYDYIPREYRFDIYAEKFANSWEQVDRNSWRVKDPIIQKVIVEIDFKGHLTKWSKHKGDIRDNVWKEKKKIATVRFPLKDLVGKKKLDDETVLKEIDFCVATLINEVTESSA